MELNERERLFVGQAFYRAAGELVSTKEPGNLRDRVDAYYKELYEQTGAKSFDAKVNDRKVGTYSVKVSKAKPASTERRFKVTDPAALLPWVADVDPEMAVEYVLQRASDFAEWSFFQTGELPDGCNVIEVGTPAMPEQYAGGVLKIDTQLVADALGARLPDAMNQLLLEGGDDD